ncbi:tRNA (adenosine(37)-N6)-dimethylallyltransferase MiaA [Aquimarina addita]|uniref:tRNA dimethylallyltransferase n=1 Tax=Aquimarina addita TaxID=870485 RepID=A0ABP6UT64_9FLAO
MTKNLIVITGPTAIGKTALSIQLANHFNCEIVSADSRQFYKEMRIGTAVPTPEELAMAPHQFIQNKSIIDTYTVGAYEKDALQKIEELFIDHNYVILVGGSGLYVDAVTRGLDNFPTVDPKVRLQLKETYQTEGIEPLQQQLKILDPIYYNKVDLQNTHRVMRALEVCISSGHMYSSFLNKPLKKRPFNTIKIGIKAERQIIYDRINQRVDLMMDEGLLDEVKSLTPHKNLNALNTVGYKELFAYLNNKWDLNTAISEIKKNTRRFAKRQLTWFKKDLEIQWFDYQDPLEKITRYIEKKVSKNM